MEVTSEAFDRLVKGCEKLLTIVLMLDARITALETSMVTTLKRDISIAREREESALVAVLESKRKGES